jgi:hypothetical protein
LNPRGAASQLKEAVADCGGPFTELPMRIIKRPKAAKLGLEAHYLSQARPAPAPAVANLGHWVVRPANARSTTRVWRFR